MFTHKEWLKAPWQNIVYTATSRDWCYNNSADNWWLKADPSHPPAANPQIINGSGDSKLWWKALHGLQSSVSKPDVHSQAVALRSEQQNIVYTAKVGK